METSAGVIKPPRRNQRRAVPRIPADFPVLITCGKRRHRCKTVELSEFGILLSLDTEDDMVGKTVQLDLTIQPKRPALSLTGIVLYDVERGIGVRFDDVSQENHFALKEYVQARGIGTAKA